MKKLTYIIAALMAVAACSKGELNQPKPVNEESGEIVPTVITAYTDKDVEKTALEGNSIVWKTTDNAMAWSATKAYKSVSTVVSEEGRKAEFTFNAQGEELLYLAYPAETATTCENGSIATFIPTSQKAVEGSFADGVNFAVGKVKEAETKMLNVGALMCVEVKDDNITSIRLTATGVAGTSTAAMDGDNISAVDAGDANSIRLGGTIEKDKSYYFVVYPGTYSSLELRFANNQGKVATLTNSQGLSLVRNGNTVIYKAEVPAGKWVDGIDIDEYKGTSIKPGTADNLCLKVEGTYLEGDKVYVSYNGGAAGELDSKFYSISDGVLSVYTHRDHIGKTVQYFLHRGSSNYQLSGPLTVATPEIAEGYVVDPAWVAKLKSCNADIATCFDVCDMVILEKANTVNPFNSTVTNLSMSGTAAKTLDGMELFNGWTASKWDAADIRAWSNSQLVNVDLSNWQGRTYLRLTSCSKMQTVVLGPKMHGGEFGGGSYRIIDLSKIENMTHFYINNVETNLELLDMRTGNSLSGVGMDLTKLAGIEDGSKLTIRIKSDMYLKHTVANTWQNGIYKAWVNGATIAVYDKDDRSVRLGFVPSYETNPDALPAGESYVKGKNWYWTDPDISKYMGTFIKPGYKNGAKCPGTFHEDTDKVFISYAGAEAVELGSDFYKFTEDGCYLYAHTNDIGKKVQYFLYREGQAPVEMSNQIDVIAPEASDGYITDAALRTKLLSIAALEPCFDACGMIDLQKAATYNPFNSTVKSISITSCNATDFSALNLFAAWEGSYWDAASVPMWNNNSVVELDFSEWVAKIAIRPTSCSKLAKVVVGPNMWGGYFGGKSLKILDFSKCNYVNMIYLENDVPVLELLDLRTGNVLCDADITLKKLSTVTNPSGLTIRITSDFYKKHTKDAAWKDGIYPAWKAGAKVEVYSIAKTDNFLGTCPSYTSNPNALPLGDYQEGVNWNCGGITNAYCNRTGAVKSANLAKTRYEQWKGSDETVIFPFITDVHANGVEGNYQIRNVNYTTEVFNYDFMVNAGDIGLNMPGTTSASRRLSLGIINNTASQMKEYGGVFLFCAGNHDFDGGEGIYHNSAYIADTFQKPFLSKAGGNLHIVEGKCYGYYDIPSKNFRVIFLNTTETETVGYGFTDAQLIWLRDLLLSTDASTDVLVISHALLHDAGRSKNDNWPASYLETYRVVNMLKDFVNRRSGSGLGVSWDFTNAKARLVGNITGDSHFDMYLYEDGLHMCTSQGLGSCAETALRPEYGQRRETFCDPYFFCHMIAIKPGKHQIKLFRMGCHNDDEYDVEWSY